MFARVRWRASATLARVQSFGGSAQRQRSCTDGCAKCRFGGGQYAETATATEAAADILDGASLVVALGYGRSAVLDGGAGRAALVRRHRIGSRIVRRRRAG